MIEVHETRVVAIYEDNYDPQPQPQPIPISDFGLLYLCSKVVPLVAVAEGKNLRRGNCFANAARLTFEDNFETVFCYCVGSDNMVHPHAIVRNGGEYFEVSPGNDGTASYYAYCAVGLTDYENVLTALGTSTAEFEREQHYPLAVNARGDLVLPFTAKDRADRPTAFPADEFVVDVMSVAAGWPIKLRD